MSKIVFDAVISIFLKFLGFNHKAFQVTFLRISRKVALNEWSLLLMAEACFYLTLRWRETTGVSIEINKQTFCLQFQYFLNFCLNV